MTVAFTTQTQEGAKVQIRMFPISDDFPYFFSSDQFEMYLPIPLNPMIQCYWFGMVVSTVSKMRRRLNLGVAKKHSRRRNITEQKTYGVGFRYNLLG